MLLLYFISVISSKVELAEACCAVTKKMKEKRRMIFFMVRVRRLNLCITYAKTVPVMMSGGRRGKIV